MSASLGTMEELPADYRAGMEAERVSPLWPMMRNVLPHGRPSATSRAAMWSYERIRPLLLRAGALTPVEKAERRVLVLNDPGRGKGAMQVTSSIYVGLQLLLPGEKAPAHRHTPSAARILVEGSGAYTIVDGEKCPMEKGDLVLTPGGMWHDHGHDGAEPVVWLDALDLPLFVYLEGSYAEEAELQAPRNRPDASAVEYRHAGLVPSRTGRAGRPRHPNPRYPMLRYPWMKTEEALHALAAQAGPAEPVELDYVNPETGDACLPTMGFTAMMLRPGETQRPPLRSASAVFHVVAGHGRSIVNGEMFVWTPGDTFSAPVFATIEHAADDTGPSFLIRVHDTPLQEKLGYYEERAR